MIFDTIQRSGLYEGISPRLAMALRILRHGEITQQPDGRYDIDHDRIFVLVQTSQTKPPDQGIWEVHRKYIDVQYIIAGSEWIGHAPLERLQSRIAYSDEKDVEFLHPPAAHEITWLDMRQGMFAVFYPHDAHHPSIATGSPSSVKKAVVKVAV